MTPTQRPASTSDARKRLAEREVSSTLVAELIGCKGCRDAGITTPTEPDADEREWNIDYALVARIIGTDPNPGEALRAFVAQEIEAATSRTPDAHLAVTSVEPGCSCGGTAACQQCQERDAHLAAARAEALEEAAASVDLSAYYDPSPAGRVSTSCHLAENAARDWLRARAARLREQGGE